MFSDTLIDDDAVDVDDLPVGPLEGVVDLKHASSIVFARSTLTPVLSTLLNISAFRHLNQTPTCGCTWHSRLSGHDARPSSPGGTETTPAANSGRVLAPLLEPEVVEVEPEVVEVPAVVEVEPAVAEVPAVEEVLAVKEVPAVKDEIEVDR